MEKESLSNLRKTLFWDVNFKKLDAQKSTQFIIGRVLDFGNLNEWKIIKEFYGLEKIRETARKHVFSDTRNTHFWAMILNIPLKNLKCTRNPSLKTPNAFLKR